MFAQLMAGEAAGYACSIVGEGFAVVSTVVGLVSKQLLILQKCSAVLSHEIQTELYSVCTTGVPARVGRQHQKQHGHYWDCTQSSSSSLSASELHLQGPGLQNNTKVLVDNPIAGCSAGSSLASIDSMATQGNVQWRRAHKAFP